MEQAHKAEGAVSDETGSGETPVRFPEWIRRAWPQGRDAVFTKDLLEGHGLHTVCQSAQCPNKGECWKARTATFMILGNRCTRKCGFCAVHPGNPSGEVDMDEPERVAEAVAAMGLKHVVITSVTRDDLEDGGAGIFAATVRAIRERRPETTIEVLTPDFRGNAAHVAIIAESGPDVFGHNIETVERLYPKLRGMRCSYAEALSVLRSAADHPSPTIIKSALMLGHGETRKEVLRTLEGLLAAGCEAVGIGQYLRPTKQQQPVAEFVRPEVFAEYEQLARDMGFRFAIAGPFVRSSYRSEEMMHEPFALERRAAARQYRQEESA